MVLHTLCRVYCPLYFIWAESVSVAVWGVQGGEQHIRSEWWLPVIFHLGWPSDSVKAPSALSSSARVSTAVGLDATWLFITCE